MPLISVVIPVTGRVDLLGETLESLRLQSFRDFEVIVTDDSPDEGDAGAIMALVDRFTEKAGVPTQLLRTSPRLGQSRNTNQGLAAASAPWVRVLHGDDLIAPHGLQREADLIAKYAPAAEIFTIDLLKFTNRFTPVGASNHALASAHWWVVNIMPYRSMLPSGTLFHRRFLDDGLRYDPAYDFCCDWVFTLGLLAGAHARDSLIVHSTWDWVGYRQHEDSVSGRGWKTHYIEARRLLNHMLEGGLEAAGFTLTPQEMDSIRGVGWESLRTRTMSLLRHLSPEQLEQVAEELFELMVEDAGMACSPFGPDDPRFFEEIAERQFYPFQARIRERAEARARALRGGVAPKRIVGVRGHQTGGWRYLDNGYGMTIRIDFTRPEELLRYRKILREEDVLEFVCPEIAGDPEQIIPALLASPMIGEETRIVVHHNHFQPACPIREIVERQTGGRFLAIEGGIEGTIARWRFRRVAADRDKA